GLVRAGAAGRVVVVVAGVLGQPVVGTRLGGHVAAGLGGAVGAVVGAVARDRNPGGAVDGRAQVGAVVARLEQVEADRAAGIRGGQGEAGVVGQRVADLAGGLARGRPERGRVEADDDGLVRAGAAGRVVVVVAGVLGQPVVGTRLGGHVAAGLGGAVGAVVGAVVGSGHVGSAVACRAHIGAVVGRLEQVEADRAAGIRGGQGEAGVVGQRVADLAGGLARGRPERGRVEADDFCFVRAGAPGSILFPYTALFRSPVVGTRLGGHVAAGLGGAVGAVVGA